YTGHVFRKVGMLDKIYDYALLKNIFHNANVGIAVCNVNDNRFAMVNPTFAKIYGYEQQDFIGRKLEDIFAPECILRLAEYETNPLHSNNEVLFETIHIRNDGTPINVSVHITFLKDENGNVRQRIVNIIDISRKKTSEQIFQDTNSKLQAIVSTIPDMIWIKDTKGVYIASNHAFQKVFGISESEVLGKTDYDFFSEEEAKMCKLSDLEAMKSDGVTICQETIIYPKSYEKGVIEVRKTPVYKSNGELMGILGIARDVTERQVYEEKLELKEKEFRTLAENSPNIIMRYDGDATRTYANPAFSENTGIPPELTFNNKPEKQWGKYFNILNMEATEYQDRIKKVFQTGQSDSLILEWIRNADDVTIAYDINFVAEKDNKGIIIGVLAIGHDITKKLETQRELKQSIEFTEGIINAIPDLLFEVDINGVYCNSWSHNDKFVLSKKEKLIGRTIRDILSHESSKIAYEAIQEANQFGVSFGKIYSVDYPDGERWFELSVSKRTTGSFLALARDITERKNIEKRVEFMAHHDTLTGLPNRVLLQDRAEKIIIKSNLNLKKSAFLFIDLDGFKTINDTLGHAFGDIVLKTVAGRLQSCIRSTDTLSRYGGDEFIVVIPDVNNENEILAVVKKIIKVFQKPFEINNQILSMTSSVGVSVYPEHGKNFEQLLQNSDTAMYKAKENGKNTYCFFKQQMKHSLIGLFQMQNDLKEAIRNKEFILHYQPQIDLFTNKIIGVEALIRWKHPAMGVVLPMSFISVAESCGCILEIGEWVIHEACRQGAIWNKNGKDIVVAVNVSAVQFKRGNLIAVVKNALKTSGLNPKYLELELTESILISDTENVLQSVRAIKELGVQLSIDDFGTGYSSLAYLKRFAVDKLKIDQSFVRDIVNDKEDATIVKTIITMAKSFNLKSIAEGVENEEVLSVLQEFGCDEVQGYHFAKPMISHEFEEYYRSISINNLL
ncbi:MAG: EAL domain-containing protein, partial [Arcobacteraceae bacterium]